MNQFKRLIAFLLNVSLDALILFLIYKAVMLDFNLPEFNYWPFLGISYIAQKNKPRFKIK